MDMETMFSQYRDGRSLPPVHHMVACTRRSAHLSKLVRRLARRILDRTIAIAVPFDLDDIAEFRQRMGNPMYVSAQM